MRVFIFCLGLLFSGLALAEDAWYEGGTLHNAKLSDWANASYHNKTATIADFVASYDAVTQKINETGNTPLLGIFTLELAICVDTLSQEEASLDTSVESAATTCAILMGYE